jgi:thiopeptide-type bacteriocin biosynthesis protein
MPADHVTLSAQQVPMADAVRLVLGGRDLRAVAASVGLEAGDLDDAVAVYHAAGTAALGQATPGRWYQAGLQLPAGLTEREQAKMLGTRLARLEQTGAVAGYWFMRKPPGWRLRLLDADQAAVGTFLSDLTTARATVACHPVIYEPETTAFGGLAGMAITHALFCADSRGALNFLRLDPPVGRRELSALLLTAMLAAAGLDWFERGDVFARVATMRPEPNPRSANQMRTLTGQLRILLAVPATAGSSPFATGGPAAFATEWRGAFEAAGSQLAAAAAAGTLTRGLRAVLAHIVIFHWNRLFLPAQAQALLARAARDALIPPD